MKKITLILLTTLLFSCGNNKEEQMLYDYQQKNVKSLNFDLKDLDYEAQTIEKVADITAKDSMKILKREFAEFWEKDAEQSLVDTISFNYVKRILNETISHKDTMQKLYQKAVLTAIKIDDYSYRWESEKKRDKAIDEMYDYKETLSKIEKLETQYNNYATNQDEVLSTKYKAVYSLKNPMLGNTKQTFDKYFYTNKAQTEFIKEESVTEEK